MKKYILMLAILFNTPFSAGVEKSVEQHEFSLPDVIARAKTIKFDKQSPQVSEAYRYFCGQNIMSVRLIAYAHWFNEGKCVIETLYVLYISLNECWLSKDGQRFIPEDLNHSQTFDNYHFLKAVFEGNS